MSQDKIQLLTADRVKWRLAVKLKVIKLAKEEIIDQLVNHDWMVTIIFQYLKD